MHEKGRPCGRPSRVFPYALLLRGELADPRRPVGERGAGPWGSRRVGGSTCAGSQQVVTGAAREERAAPGRVVAGVGDVLAGDPDRVPVRGCCAIVAPPLARRVAYLR